MSANTLDIASIPAPRSNRRLIGHDHAAQVLDQAFARSRLPHAWLLHGPSGIGKATLAFRFARYLLAEPAARGNGLAVAEHTQVARLIDQGAHPDLRMIDATSGEARKARAAIPVEPVREAVAHAHATAAMGGYRVLVIDPIEALNANAANAVLKLIEEPPRRTVILCISHRPEMTLATIRSRCARLRLAPLSDADCVSAIALAAGVDEAEAAALTSLAPGRPGAALRRVQTGWPALLHETLMCLSAADTADLHKQAHALAGLAADEGFQPVSELLGLLVHRAMRRAAGRALAPILPDETALLEAWSARVPLDRWPALWDNALRRAGLVDGLYLDASQTALILLDALAHGALLEDAA